MTVNVFLFVCGAQNIGKSDLQLQIFPEIVSVCLVTDLHEPGHSS